MEIYYTIYYITYIITYIILFDTRYDVKKKGPRRSLLKTKSSVLVGTTSGNKIHCHFITFITFTRSNE